jgi:primosomal protein N''
MLAERLLSRLLIVTRESAHASIHRQHPGEEQVWVRLTGRNGRFH